ncbi:hypothetical protein QQY66_36495 [Streptomyces sp. DG2A-72]|uniref:hypothetical protein n=1 Tax=Streptomyces sp. DG2A-72 TaxID=3051386 RepID=UPI00265C2FF6|nr:hypothetical protein [Streptomyces sp. DG2A-72]MDO0936949.1 hypothetical protein [Streptomyces sp. DG2A-72]
MLALRLTRVAQPAVHLRRLAVAAASAATGFLLLSALGHAMSHQDPAASTLRLTWCTAPLATTVYFAVAVARTDPGTKPRPGLSAIGLGPGRLMITSALTTALATTVGSLLALLAFLHLRGDLTGVPFAGAATDYLATGQPLPLPATLTLLTLVPAIASLSTALALRPKDPRRPAHHGAPRKYGRFGAYGLAGARETFGAYGRFGARLGRKAADTHQAADSRQAAGSRAAGAAPVGAGGTPPAPGSATDPPAATPDAAPVDAHLDPPAPREAPRGLPWGITVLAAGLTVEAYASRTADPTSPGLLAGWALTALGLALAAPGLTHLCGRLLQSAHPGALRLLAGRVLMEESARIGRPLGIVCAVASAAYTTALVHDTEVQPLGSLTDLGALVVVGCTAATLLTAAVEAKQARADTTAALLRLGAPAAMLRSAAALRAGALLALFGPLTLIVAELAALPMAVG